MLGKATLCLGLLINVLPSHVATQICNFIIRGDFLKGCPSVRGRQQGLMVPGARHLSPCSILAYSHFLESKPRPRPEELVQGHGAGSALEPGLSRLLPLLPVLGTRGL